MADTEIIRISPYYKDVKDSIKEAIETCINVAYVINENKPIRQIVGRGLVFSDLLIEGTKPLESDIIEIDPGYHDIDLFNGSYARVPEGKAYLFYGFKLLAMDPRVIVRSIDFKVGQCTHTYVVEPYYRNLVRGVTLYFHPHHILKENIPYDIVIHAENLTDKKQKLRFTMLGYVAEPIY